MGKRNWWALTVITVMVALACSGTESTPAPASATPAAPASPEASMPAESLAPAIPTEATGYTELDQALGADKPFNGKSVNIQTQWVGGEGTNFADSMKDFATATGIKLTIDSIGSSYETLLKTRIDGGSPPDIAQLAQPTPVLAYGAEGKLIDVASFMDAQKLADEHTSTISLITDADGHIWGIPYKQDVKSVVWYPIKAFEAKGYQIPTTWQELLDLSDQIVADGGTPWCISAGGPGDATGWQITDWVEQVVLGTQGLDYYNQWISHDVTFEDPGIKAAFDDYVGKIFFTDGYVYGGNDAIINTDQKTVMDPMFNPPDDDMSDPLCWMQKVPTWYGPDYFPDQRTTNQPSKYIVGQDVGLFAFPTIDPAQNYAEGSADTMIVLADRPEVRAVAEFMATPWGIENWIRAGSAISANTSTPADWYAGSYKLKVASEIANNAAGIGFDASDLMPGAVGSGSFWTESVDWVKNGGTNTDAVLQAIDQSWPSQ